MPVTSRTRSVALALLLGVVVALAAPVQADIPVPDEGALLGVYPKPKDGDWTVEGQKRRYEYLEGVMGRRFDIGHYFHKWDAGVPTWREEWHVEQGRVPMISWANFRADGGGVYSSEIVAGQEDDLIRAHADSLRDFGSPILVRWFWEMDGSNKAEWAQDPETWIAAWRHIVSIFREQGADNVEFVWCPNAWAFNTGDGADWYPGDGWVDWLCADGYNWAPGQDGAEWMSLGDIFGAFHDWGAGKNKPMMIGETGVQERNPGEKPAWILDIPDELRTRLPAVKALVYFDSDTIYDWWIDSTPDSLEAFADMSQDSWFNASGDGGGGGGGGGGDPDEVFTDIDGSVFEADILWLREQGVTLGCNPPDNDRFCPTDPVSRGQMASFLARALDLPESASDPFGDDEGSVHEANINALAAAGITVGYEDGTFRPSQSMSRAHMAAFLYRAYRLDPGGADAFSDDAGDYFEGEINALAAAGITEGCNPSANDHFCPRSEVTRGQMAAFLHRADGL